MASRGFDCLILMPAQDRTVSAVVTELNNIASVLDAGTRMPYSELDNSGRYKTARRNCFVPPLALGYVYRCIGGKIRLRNRN